jgi:hypothetical protein
MAPRAFLVWVYAHKEQDKTGNEESKQKNHGQQ